MALNLLDQIKITHGVNAGARALYKPDKNLETKPDAAALRGLTNEKAKVDVWIKDITPSTELRKWFSHDPEKWKEFREKYLRELKENKE